MFFVNGQKTKGNERYLREKYFEHLPECEEAKKIKRVGTSSKKGGKDPNVCNFNHQPPWSIFYFSIRDKKYKFCLESGATSHIKNAFNEIMKLLLICYPDDLGSNIFTHVQINGVCHLSCPKTPHTHIHIHIQMHILIEREKKNLKIISEYMALSKPYNSIRHIAIIFYQYQRWCFYSFIRIICNT